MRKICFVLISVIACLATFGQDSMMVRVHPKYDSVGKLHRKLFGENYRKEWSMLIKVPVFKISEMKGGLKPLRTGGGHQTLSLRLLDPNGKEWVLRSIEKDPSVLLPLELRETFAADVVNDAMSAQNPFGPLAVPDMAKAANVAHSNPVIGIVADDPALGEFQKLFAGKIVLFEERDPLGKSDNSAEMMDELKKDNDNNYDSRAYLRARLLDLFIGDWDRHADQWRWKDEEKGKEKMYVAVPRDRDQTFYINQGFFPRMASRPWIAPNLQGFGPRVKHVRYSLLESNFLNARPSSQFNYAEWMQITNDFTKAMTDEVLEEALKKLPPPAYELRHQQLLDALKKRRENLPAAMTEYYRFINRIPDIRLSDKNEWVQVTGTPEKAMHVAVLKRTKKGASDTLMSTLYDPSITKEIRIYTGKGDDSISIDNQSSPIKLRIIGNDGNKGYNVSHTAAAVRVYEKTNTATFTGSDAHRLRKHLSNDTSNTAFIATNCYNVAMPLITGGFNLDDGLLLGLGIQYKHHGFRKLPYAGLNRLTVAHSFSTSAFKIRYRSEWIQVFRKTDLTITADIFAPNNTQNFFGRGNETVFDKIPGYKKFYRARFSIYQAALALRWKLGKTSTLGVGPVIQHYRFDSVDNKGRFINTFSAINSYDSVTYTKSKTHAGLVLNLLADNRNNKILPFKGYYFNVKVLGLGGLGDYAKSFMQVIPEFAVYKRLGRSSIVFAERIGGGFTFGKSAFYQSTFIGGHENLLGYRQYRFAGEQMAYSNTEVRIKLAKFTGYIIPGQFGLVGFYDIGRVWIKDESSNKWHSGTGGGFYFAPAQMAVISAVAGYSEEGWYPYITLGFRF